MSFPISTLHLEIPGKVDELIAQIVGMGCFLEHRSVKQYLLVKTYDVYREHTLPKEFVFTSTKSKEEIKTELRTHFNVNDGQIQRINWDYVEDPGYHKTLVGETSDCLKFHVIYSCEPYGLYSDGKEIFHAGSTRRDDVRSQIAWALGGMNL